MNETAIAARYARELGNWQIDRILGRGGFGEVFRIRRERFGVTEAAAMKIVHLMNERKRLGRIPEDYYRVRRNLRENDLKEVVLMQQLAGNTNIVNVQDWDVKDWEEGDAFGCDLVIRMELLQSLDSILEGRSALSEQEVARIGIDICRALELCHGKGIIHRDIKPGNIFRNREGAYKIGDFGISRISEGGRASTRAGTPVYAAPEQMNGTGKYGNTVDIYSLGLTLYQLLNHNRLPFIFTDVFSNQTLVDANMKRCSGAPLPALTSCSPRLSAAVLKACAFRPEDRYQTARAFRTALEEALNPGAAPVRSPKPAKPQPAVSRTSQVNSTQTFDQALTEARNELMQLMDRQTAWGNNYVRYRAGDARRCFEEAEAAAAGKKYTDAINKLYECARVLRLDSDYQRPAYLCWKHLEYYLACGNGEGNGKSMARHYYDLAVKKKPGLKNADMEKRIQDHEGQGDQELVRLEQYVRGIPGAARAEWAEELQSLFRAEERSHPFTPEEEKVWRSVTAEMQQARIDLGSMITRLSPLARKYARAEYLMARAYEKNGDRGTYSYWGCGRLLGKYPAGLCLEGLEAAIRHQDVQDARNWYNRLKSARQ